MTTSAIALLATIRRHGGDIKLMSAERLKIVAPPTLLPDFVEQARAVKSELLIALSGPAPPFRYHLCPPNADQVQRWQERLTANAFDWFNGRRDWDAALRLAWGDLENEWHALYGLRSPAWQCAGCGKPISGRDAINMPDGNRVHFEPIDCMIDFGRRWRGEARRALVTLGLRPIDEENK